MKRTNAYVRNIAAMLIFGSVGIFVQAIPMRSSELVAARTIMGSFFLCCILVIRRQKPDWSRVKNQLGMLLVSGVVLGANWMFLFTAYQYTSVSVATLLYYCAPVLVLCLSPVLLREKLTWSKLAGIIVAVIGMVMVNGTQTGGTDPQKGFVYGLLAAFFYAGVILLNKRITEVPVIEKTLVQMLAAAVVMSAYAVFTHSGRWGMPHGKGFLALVTVGIVHTGIAYLLYISSMSELSGQTVALSSYIDPASALIFSAVFLQEKLTNVQVLGAVFILGGSAFGEMYCKKKENMIKAIFFDIDGTLLSHRIKDVPMSTRQALDQLSELHVDRVIATGRHSTEIDILPVNDIKFDAYITLNGQLCYDSEGNVFYENPLQETEEILKLFHGNTVPVMLIEEKRMYINFINDDVVQAQEEISTPVPPVMEYTGNYVCMSDRGISLLYTVRSERIYRRYAGGGSAFVSA